MSLQEVLRWQWKERSDLLGKGLGRSFSYSRRIHAKWAFLLVGKVAIVDVERTRVEG